MSLKERYFVLARPDSTVPWKLIKGFTPYLKDVEATIKTMRLKYPKSEHKIYQERRSRLVKTIKPS